MGIIWAITLGIYGLINGWDKIHHLAWLLLIPMFAEDVLQASWRLRVKEKLNLR